MEFNKKQIIDSTVTNIMAQAEKEENEPIEEDDDIKIDPVLEKDYNDVIAEINRLMKEEE